MSATIDIHHSQATYYKDDKQFMTEVDTIKFDGEPEIKMKGKNEVKSFYFDHQDAVEENLTIFSFKSYDDFELFVVDDRRKG